MPTASPPTSPPRSTTSSGLSLRARLLVIAVVFGACFGVRLYFDARSASAEEIPLRVPFESFPQGLLGESWSEEARTLEERVENIAGVSAYLSRGYERDGRPLWFYFGYVGAWRAGAIHHPGVCFSGSGRQQQGHSVVEIRDVGSLGSISLNEYTWRLPSGRRAYTLSAFYYHDRFEPSEVRLRADRIHGVPYFAVLIVDGPSFGSIDEDRSFYFDKVRKLVPAAVSHLPQGADH